jgi:hypothetical protein
MVRLDPVIFGIMGCISRIMFVMLPFPIILRRIPIVIRFFLVMIRYYLTVKELFPVRIKQIMIMIYSFIIR